MVVGGLGRSYLDVRLLYSVQYCTSVSVPAIKVGGVIGWRYLDGRMTGYAGATPVPVVSVVGVLGIEAI